MHGNRIVRKSEKVTRASCAAAVYPLNALIDEDEVEILRRQLSLSELPSIIGKDPKLILDVGANDGGTSAVFLRLFPTVFVHAFEPDRRAIEHCLARVRSGNIDARRFILHELAVADFNGIANYFPSFGTNSAFNWYESGYDLAGSLNEPIEKNYPGIDTVFFGDPVKVQVRRLDDVLRPFSLGEIDLLWMDVQGGELPAVRGGSETIKKARFLFVECIDEVIYKGQCSLATLQESLHTHELVYSFSDGNHLFKNSK